MKKLGRIQQLDDDEEDFQSKMSKNKTEDKSNKEEQEKTSGFNMTNLAQVGVGLGALAVGGFALWKASKMVNEEQIPNLVEDDDQLKKKLQKITKDAGNFPVVGFKCHWTEREERSRVVLVEIASHKGETVLISLDKFSKFPEELRKFLENIAIIKTGVDIEKETGYLFADHGLGVYSTFDLRFLARETGNPGDSLAKLSASVLDIGIGPEIKDWSVIDARRQNYAESCVQTSINLFKTLYSFVGRGSSKADVISYCTENLNKKFL